MYILIEEERNKVRLAPVFIFFIPNIGGIINLSVASTCRNLTALWVFSFISHEYMYVCVCV